MNEKFLAILDSEKIKYSLNEPMSRHTTFKIGGNADIFVEVSSVEQLKKVQSAAKECGISVFILGKGSNLLVSDSGIIGVVVSLCKLDEVSVDGDVIECQSGTSLMNVCTAAQKAGLSGLEFAYGIPGSVGGAIFMNAGAYGGEICDVTVSVDAMDNYGNIVTFLPSDINFGYRTSVFKTNNFIILKAVLKLKAGDKAEIKKSMNDYFSRRKEKQPLDFPNAGSTFKRPQGNYAGALIEKNGLKGFSVGDAQVSEKHAGFIINRGNATCEDVLGLIDAVKQTVFKNDKVVLEPEIIHVGRKQ